MSGKFITLEGIEGSGKSTSLETIQSFLESRDIQYITTKEPGGGQLAKNFALCYSTRNLKFLLKLNFF